MGGQDSRQQLVAGAADMLRRRGLNATSIREVAKHAGAPLGSTYHYFPGGKDQLAAEAVRLSSDVVTRVLDKKLRQGPVEGVQAFFELWRQVVAGNDFKAGCPVVAVAVEETDHPEALKASAEAFRAWSRQLAGALEEHGVAPQRAAQLATLVIGATEGAVVMCRAQRSVEPLDDVAKELTALLASAVRT
ncbi:MAG TPA: TetR/AcrR family transcriptional regulator [Lentzea sp.]